MKPPHTATGLRSLESLLAALETLRRAPDGAALLGQIERGREIERALAAIVEQAFLAFLQNALDRYQRRPGVDSTTRLKAKVIARQAAALADTATVDTGAAQLSLPLLQDPSSLEQHLVAMLWVASATLAREMRDTGLPTGDGSEPEPPNRDEQIKPVIQALTRKLDQSMVCSADNVVRLKIVASSLTRANSRRNLDEMRELLQDAVQELLEDNESLDERLQEARYSINDIALRMSMPAEKADPAAANREALLRRMQVEARRAERHRHPLTLALLGPDFLNDIDQLVGPNSGREIIRLYMEGITSCARAYDVVAPCDPHGLVWLLPGTQTAQGVQALVKVRQHLADSRYQYGGRLRPLPSFSAAVVGYLPGETPAGFLRRAQLLAQRARDAGPGCIERDS